MVPAVVLIFNQQSARIKVTRMGSIVGHRIDYNAVGVLRGQRHIPSKA